MSMQNESKQSVDLQFIYVLKPVRLAMLSDGPSEAEAEVLGQHVAFLNTLLEESVAVLFGRTQTTGAETFGIVVLRAQSDEHARLLMNADPAVANGVMTASLFPFSVAGMLSS